MEEKNDIRTIPNSGAQIRKKDILRRIIDFFFADELDQIGPYLKTDVVKPTIRELGYNIAVRTAEMLFLGTRGAASAKRSRSDGNPSYVQYGKYYTGSGAPEQRINLAKNVYSEDEAFFPDNADKSGSPLVSKDKANNLIIILNEQIERSGKARKSMVYDILEITGRDYTDEYYGWMEPIASEPVRVRGGYVVRLPRPVELPKD